MRPYSLISKVATQFPAMLEMGVDKSAREQLSENLIRDSVHHFFLYG
jgi:hypothetical protein